MPAEPPPPTFDIIELHAATSARFFKTMARVCSGEIVEVSSNL
jgi:hypothetical protein